MSDRNRLLVAGVLLAAFAFPGARSAQAGWGTFAGNPQHTALSAVASQPLQFIRWSTPVDLAPPTGSILIHYGSPLVTPGNTVIVPVKTGSTGGYLVEARTAQDGSLLWSADTDYILPPHNWTPSYSPTLTASNRLYFAGAGGTVYFRDAVDTGGPATIGHLAFFGLSNYLAARSSFDATVFVDSPLTADAAGTIYFAFRTSGSAPLGLQSGIARIDAAGNGSWVSAVAASGGDTEHHPGAAPGGAGPEQRRADPVRRRGEQRRRHESLPGGPGPGVAGPQGVVPRGEDAGRVEGSPQRRRQQRHRHR